MQARAIHRFVGTSPRKMRLVIDMIRGKGVEEALSILHFTPKHASKTAEMVLRSAISNIQSKDEAGRVDPSTVFVKEVFVNGGPTMKRVMPAPMGRAFRVRKRSNHITIVVEQKAELIKKQPAARATSKTEKPAARKPARASKPKTTRKKSATAATSK